MLPMMIMLSQRMNASGDWHPLNRVLKSFLSHAKCSSLSILILSQELKATYRKCSYVRTFHHPGSYGLTAKLVLYATDHNIAQYHNY